MSDFTEYFWSRRSAERAAARLSKQGYTSEVSFARRADGSHDWLVTANWPRPTQS